MVEELKAMVLMMVTIELFVVFVGFGAPLHINTVMGYNPDELLPFGMMDTNSNYYDDKTPENIFNEVSNMLDMGSNSSSEENQKIADEARFEQNAMDYYNKSLEYKTACPNGGNYTLDDFRSSIYGVDKTCMEPEEDEIKGAIILFK